MSSRSVAQDMIIGFDLDGVIIDHAPRKMRLAARYGLMLTPEETHSEMMRTRIPKEIEKELRYKLYDDPDEALDSPLMEGAYDGLSRLSELGIPFVLISRQKNPLQALHLIESHGLWGNCFTPESTHFVGKMEDKDRVARALGVTHFFDDEREVLALMPSVPNRFLYDQRDLFPDDPTYTRVKNWPELLATLSAV